MKKTFCRIGRLFSIGAIICCLLLAGCGKGDDELSALAGQIDLFGATHYTANVSNTSYLYKINSTDGSTTLIGDIGFKVDSMAYDAVTKKLYGITEGAGSQLIEINMTTGQGTLIAGITVAGVSVAVDNGWDGIKFVSSIGTDGTDYYGQSFIATASAITKFGVPIRQLSAAGEISLAIAADNGGVPNYAAPLYHGTLKTPTPTFAWYYDSGINVSVTIGQKYYVLLDGYNPPGATGYSGIGVSDTQPIPGEGITFSNNGGGAWVKWTTYPLAIYIEGTGYSYFSRPAFNAAGQLFAWHNAGNALCSINTTTGAATCFASSGVRAVNFGLAFNHKDVLYLVNGGGNVYTVDQTTGAATSAGSLTDLPNGMAHRGAFQHGVGVYWGLDNVEANTATRNLLVVNIGLLGLYKTIPTRDHMQALAIVHK